MGFVGTLVLAFALVQGTPAAAQSTPAPAQGTLLTPAAGTATRAHVEATPDHARIGEPIELAIVVEHAAGATVTLPDPAALPRSLAFVEDLGLRRKDDPSAPGRKITRARWSVMALEGGDLTIPPLAINVDEGGGPVSLSAALPVLAIEHALQSGEDAPRPARGFRPTPSVHMWSLRGIATAVVLVALIAVAALVVWKRRTRRKLPVAASVSSLDQLAQLEARAQAEPGFARNLTYELTALVRAAADAHVKSRRDGLTDSDWSQAVAADERLPELARARAIRLLAAAERVKYAQESPSPLAVREWLSEARGVLEALDGARRIAA